MSVFQDLHDSEINARIDWFYDGGFNVSLGDSLNGYKARATGMLWEEVAPWLTEQAIEHFPHSQFARKYRGRPRLKRVK